jgi:hypothetical protein
VNCSFFSFLETPRWLGIVKGRNHAANILKTTDNVAILGAADVFKGLFFQGWQRKNMGVSTEKIS